MSANAAPQFTRDADGFARSGDIEITVMKGVSALFVWTNAVAFGLMVDSSLGGEESPLWELHSTVGFSSALAYGSVPLFAEAISGPVALIPGRRYFVSVYGAYPRFGIQEFER